MGVVQLVLFSFVYCVSGINSETVDFFSICGHTEHKGSERVIYNTDKLTVTMRGYYWQDSSKSCTVVFKASRSIDDLYIKFNSFMVSDNGITVKMKSKFSESTDFSLEDTYGFVNSPSIGYADRTNRYLKITVTKDSSLDQGVTADFDVYTDVYHRNQKHGRLDDTIVSSVGSSIAVIVGSVIGGIALIVITVVVIVCLVCNSASRRNRGGVMTTTGPNAYSYQAAPPILATHPVGYPAQSISYPGQPGAYPVQPGTYPAQPGAYSAQPGAYLAQPGAYPAQPGAYPAQPGANQPLQMPYSSAPPAYNSLSSGNSNLVDEKVPPKAPS